MATRFITLLPVFMEFYGNYGKGLPPAPSWYLKNSQGPLNYNWSNALYFYDSVNYAHIGMLGYTNKFFSMWPPVYPLLIRLFSVFSHNEQLVSVITANIVYVFCFYVFFVLEHNRLNNFNRALISVSLFGIFPGSVYFSCAYAESTALTLIMLAIYFAYIKKDSIKNVLLSGIFSGLSIVTRIASITLPMAILIESLGKWGWKKKVVYGTFSFIFFILLLVFFQIKFGNFLIFDAEERIVYARYLMTFFDLFKYEFKYFILHSAGGVVYLIVVNLMFGLIAILSVFDKYTWSPKMYTILSLVMLFDMGILKGTVDPMFGLFRYVLLIPSIYTLSANIVLKGFISKKTVEIILSVSTIALFLLETAIIGTAVGMKSFIS